MFNLKCSFLFILIVLATSETKSKKNYSPHCTHITKDTDYISNYRFDYPVAYVLPGQREAYQKMYCVNPPAVNKAVTTVCDWAAPPQVEFTLADDYMHVVRQDPSGQFLGNAIINTYQLCNHNIPPHLINKSDSPFVTSLSNESLNYLVRPKD